MAISLKINRNNIAELDEAFYDILEINDESEKEDPKKCLGYGL